MLTSNHKMAIQDLLARVVYGYDQKDLDMIRACFTVDAHFSLTVAGNDYPPNLGREAIIAMMTESLNKQRDKRRHVISNIFFVEEETERAQVCSMMTLHAIKDNDLHTLTTGYYRDDVLLDGDRWYIDRRRASIDLSF